MANELVRIFYCTADNLKDEVYGYPLCAVWEGHAVITKTTKYLGPDLNSALDYIDRLNGRYIVNDTAFEDAIILMDYITGGSNGYMQ